MSFWLSSYKSAKNKKTCHYKDTSKCHGVTFTDLAAEESFSWIQLVTNSQRGQTELKVWSNQYWNTIRMNKVSKKVDMVLMQDRAGNKNWLCGKNRCWGRKFGRVSVWAPRCLFCSGAKLASVKRRTAKSPKPRTNMSC